MPRLDELIIPHVAAVNEKYATTLPQARKTLTKLQSTNLYDLSSPLSLYLNATTRATNTLAFKLITFVQ